NVRNCPSFLFLFFSKFCFLSLVTVRYEVVGSADSVLAGAGEDVILLCSVKLNISVVDMRVEWFRSDLRDSVMHLLSDEGLYKCFIKSKSWNDNATVDFKVEAVGRPPVITVDGFDHSGGLHLQCESEGWYPEPDLEWLDSEGVSLSSETTETHRNTDGFITTVHHRDDKIHCRVKLRHHMLEALIISSMHNVNVYCTVHLPVIAVYVLYKNITVYIFNHFESNRNKCLTGQCAQCKSPFPIASHELYRDDIRGFLLFCVSLHPLSL
uniref:Zgc:123297 n=1 Tax=Cyprinus carpio TaxID=7962 RepID=A0A8C1YYM8_CYPCA